MKAFANGSSVQKSIKESIQNYRESKSTQVNKTLWHKMNCERSKEQSPMTKLKSPVTNFNLAHWYKTQFRR
jgi:hypothetical protein